MKKLNFRGLLCLLILSNGFISQVYAQKLIARQGGGSPSFHTSLDEAITQANNGDTLYIPGGYFEVTVPISKELHLIGEGHNPKYSMANGVTYINGTFTIQQEASKSSFHGLNISPYVTLGEGTKNLLFERCNMAAFNYTVGGFKEYITCNEVIFRNQLTIDLKYSQFNSCIFNSSFRNSYRNCTFRNNLFLVSGYICDEVWDYWGNLIRGYIDFSLFENNIFYASNGIRLIGNTVFNNNIFIYEQTFDGTNLIGSNNIVGQIPESIFVNHTGNQFLYESDFHLKATSPGKNAGTDGKDIGIYGGSSPWKESCFPFNPHVIFKNVTGSTSADGTLNVNIKVEAQQN